MFIRQVPIPTGVEFWLARELDAIKAQGTAIEAKIEKQGTALEAKIEKQGTALEVKIEKQGTAIEANIEKMADRLAANEMALVLLKRDFRWVAALFALLEIVLANKDAVIGALEAIRPHK